MIILPIIAYIDIISKNYQGMPFLVLTLYLIVSGMAFTFEMWLVDANLWQLLKKLVHLAFNWSTFQQLKKDIVASSRFQICRDP